MFDALSDRLQGIFKRLRGQGRLTEENVVEAAREIRKALLEADVHYQVAKDFVAGVAKRASGQEVLASVTPGQQFVKVVSDALIDLLGREAPPMRFANEGPSVWMLVGLQGTGKTTTAAKLARFLSAKGRRPLLVAADVRRPAAVEQLKTLGEQVKMPVFSQAGSDAVAVCEASLVEARRAGCDAVILDTAGRLHIDEDLMRELSRIVERTRPIETLWVLDAMVGQDAVNAAKGFAERLSLTGLILTKMDGDARGGAALSARSVTGVPIRFIGTGEKSDRLEAFDAARLAARILGMGDIVGLVEKAQEVVDVEKAKRMEEKLRKGGFDLEDLLAQMEQIRKMGSLRDLMGMIPGMGQALKGADLDEGKIGRTRAIIQSMTRKERRTPDLIDGSRRRRIAAGSGTSVQEVNALLRDFGEMRKLMKMAGAGKLPGGMRLPKGMR